jgi:hypothetical protein
MAGLTLLGLISFHSDFKFSLVISNPGESVLFGATLWHLIEPRMMDWIRWVHTVQYCQFLASTHFRSSLTFSKFLDQCICYQQQISARLPIHIVRLRPCRTCRALLSHRSSEELRPELVNDSTFGQLSTHHYCVNTQPHRRFFFLPLQQGPIKRDSRAQRIWVLQPSRARPSDD